LPHTGQNVAPAGICAPQDMQNFFSEVVPTAAEVVPGATASVYTRAADLETKTPNIGDTIIEIS